MLLGAARPRQPQASLAESASPMRRPDAKIGQPVGKMRHFAPPGPVRPRRLRPRMLCAPLFLGGAVHDGTRPRLADVSG